MEESPSEYYERQVKLLAQMIKEIDERGHSIKKLRTTRNYLHQAHVNFTRLAADTRGFNISAVRTNNQ